MKHDMLAQDIRDDAACVQTSSTGMQFGVECESDQLFMRRAECRCARGRLRAGRAAMTFVCTNQATMR
jgi:hypothetical protein